jgi:hypothetical protein
MSRASGALFAGVVALALAAGVVLTAGARPSAAKVERARAFHGLVGGLGFGPALDLSPCEFSFDPRLCPACSQDVRPLPGGMFFCPYHASAVLDYAEMRGRE